ncbi:DUF927 domain-containing protein [Myxococcota bacterium]|nr:DUF927 domain-containing protein [Myxococcota bacterium]
MLDALEAAGCKPRRRWGQYEARCPAHDDRTPSLGLKASNDGHALLTCRAGCETPAVVAALGLRMRDLMAGDGPAPQRERTRRDRAPEWRCVVPVPDTAPAPPKLRGEVGRWAYPDAERRLLGYVVRIEPGAGGRSKDYRPRTWCVAADGRAEWRLLSWPTPRPLYGLHALASRPDAPVIVAEGERSADAAARLLLDHVAVTSPGGVDGARHADWTALRGRHVTAWPDADEPGAKYAADVARLAREAGAASVRVVALPEGLPKGWDLADPVPDDVDVLELLRGAPEADAEPASGVRRPFSLKPDGVYAQREGKDGETTAERVCSPLFVDALARSDAGEEWGRLLRVVDPDDAEHVWAMPMRLLSGDGAEARGELLSLGLRIAPGRWAREMLTRYLAETTPATRARCVQRIGWHRSVFVLPDETYGASAAEHVVLQTASPLAHAYETAGTLTEWQQHVAAPCADHSRLVLTLSAAFAGPLMDLAGAEGGGVHFRGPSSIGKSMALGVGASVWGGSRDGGYVRTWRATSNGLESVAATHSDTLLCLDELSEIDAREAGAAAYMLSNGKGKTRAGRDGGARRSASWRVMFLSSGEISLADKVREDGRRRVTAGQQVRLLDIPADAGAGFGLFDSVGGADSAALADALRTASRTYYGTAARAFLAELTRDRDAAAKAVRDAVADWTAEHVPPAADGQVVRAAARFALLAAAGELATALGVLPWPAGTASVGVARCWADWLRERGTTGPAELAAALERVRAWLGAHGASRFAALRPAVDRDGEPIPERVIDRAGWWRDGDDGTREYLVLPSVWKAELAAGIDARSLVSEMTERGWLRPDAAGKASQSIAVPGHGKQRLYVVTAEALGGDDDAA